MCKHTLIYEDIIDNNSIDEYSDLFTKSDSAESSNKLSKDFSNSALVGPYDNHSSDYSTSGFVRSDHNNKKYSIFNSNFSKDSSISDLAKSQDTHSNNIDISDFIEYDDKECNAISITNSIIGDLYVCNKAFY